MYDSANPRTGDYVPEAPEGEEPDGIVTEEENELDAEIETVGDLSENWEDDDIDDEFDEEDDEDWEEEDDDEDEE